MKTTSNFSKLLSDELPKHTADMYAGRIRQTCTEDCPADCSGDHGFYELPEEYENLFEAFK